MSTTIEVSDERYAALERVAAARGQTPSRLVEALVADIIGERRVYDDLDDFFRSLGMSEEDIAASAKMADQPELYFPDSVGEDESHSPHSAEERTSDANI